MSNSPNYRDRMRGARGGQTFGQKLAEPWGAVGDQIRGTADVYRAPEGTSTAGRIARGATAIGTAGLVGSQQSTEASPFGVVGRTGRALAKNVGTTVAEPFRALSNIGTKQRVSGFDTDTGLSMDTPAGARSTVGAELGRVGTWLNPFDDQSKAARDTKSTTKQADRMEKFGGEDVMGVEGSLADRIQRSREERGVRESSNRGRIDAEGLLTEEQRQRFIKLALIKS
jgi:hypothetical protein